MFESDYVNISFLSLSFCFSKMDVIIASTYLLSRESACNAGDQGSIPGLGSFSGEGNGNPLQYSCLENSVDWEAWRVTVSGVTKSQT